MVKIIGFSRQQKTPGMQGGKKEGVRMLGIMLKIIAVSLLFIMGFICICLTKASSAYDRKVNDYEQLKAMKTKCGKEPD